MGHPKALHTLITDFFFAHKRPLSLWFQPRHSFYLSFLSFFLTFFSFNFFNLVLPLGSIGIDIAWLVGGGRPLFRSCDQPRRANLSHQPTSPPSR